MTSTSLAKQPIDPSAHTGTPKTPLGEYGDADTEWDLPPPKAPAHIKTLDNSVWSAGRAASGSPSLKMQARAVAAEQEVSNTDFGDLQTWALIGLMFLTGLVIAATAYLLPHGQHCTFPPLKVY